MRFSTLKHFTFILLAIGRSYFSPSNFQTSDSGAQTRKTCRFQTFDLLGIYLVGILVVGGLVVDHWHGTIVEVMVDLGGSWCWFW